MSGVAKLRSEYNHYLHFLQIPLTFPHSTITNHSSLIKRERTFLEEPLNS